MASPSNAEEGTPPPPPPSPPPPPPRHPLPPATRQDIRGNKQATSEDGSAATGQQVREREKGHGGRARLQRAAAQLL